MKFPFLIIGCCLLILAAAAAPAKLVIVGKPELADPVVAELSGDPAFDLLERSAVAVALREHKLTPAELTGSKLAKLFPHVDLFAVVDQERVVVFNAGNGFRLADGEHRGSCEAIAWEIRRSAAKVAGGEPIGISTVAIRDIGVPRRLREKLEAFAAEVERRLLNDPQIQVLERARLGLVDHERQLTGVDFALTASAYLLVFEFEPEGSGKGVKARVVMQDLERREVGRVEIADVLADPAGGVIRCGEEIRRQLPAPSQRPDKGRESWRFALESRELFRNGKYGDALARIQSVLALDGDRPEYRLTELKIRAKLCTAMPWNSARLKAAGELLEAYGLFFASVPADGMLREGFLNVSEAFTVKSCTEERSLTAEDWREMPRVCGEYRRYRELTCRKLYPSTLPGRMSSLADLGRYNRRLNFGVCLLHLDGRREFAEHLENYRAFFAAADAFARKHPERRERLEKLLIPHQVSLIHAVRVHREEWKEYIRQTLPIVELLEKSPLTGLKHTCIAIRFLQRLQEKPLTEEHVTTEIDRYLRELSAHDPGALKEIADYGSGEAKTAAQRAAYSTFFILTEYTDNTFRKAEVLVRGRAMKMDQTPAPYAPLRLLVDGLSLPATAAELDQLLASQEGLRRFAAERIRSWQTHAWFAGFANAQFGIVDGSPEQRERKERLFSALNSDLQVRRFSWAELAGEPVECLATAQVGGTLYATLRNGEGRVVLMEGTLPDQFRILGTVKGMIPLQRRLYPKRGPSVYLAAGDGVIALADRKTLRIFRPDTGKSQVIDDPLGGIPPSGLAISGGRIFLLGSGRAGRAGETRTREKRNGASLLVSFDIVTGDRITHFSTERAEKKNFLDHSNGEPELYTNLQALGGEQLFFHSEKTAWKYHWQKDSFQELAVSPAPFSSYIRSIVADGRIYLSSTWRGGQFTVIDPEKGEQRVLLAFKEKAPYYPPECSLKEPFLWIGGRYPFMNADYPFLRRGDRLFIAGLRPFALDLKAPGNSPVLLLPGCFNLHSVGGWIAFVNEHWLFVLTGEGKAANPLPGSVVLSDDSGGVAVEALKFL